MLEEGVALLGRAEIGLGETGTRLGGSEFRVDLGFLGPTPGVGILASGRGLVRLGELVARHGEGLRRPFGRTGAHRRVDRRLRHRELGGGRLPSCTGGEEQRPRYNRFCPHERFPFAIQGMTVGRGRPRSSPPSLPKLGCLNPPFSGCMRVSMVDFILKRPYTLAASLILICLLGIGAGLRMPTDIFPEINIPVVSVVWTYNGMAAEDIQNRIVVLHERQLASLVDDIERIEANSYQGVGVIKVYLHEGADVSRAVSQLASSALVVLKYMPPNITPPLVLRYGATDVPIIELSVSSPSLSDTRLNDLGQNIIRPDLAVVRGASVPYPYGGKH